MSRIDKYNICVIGAGICGLSSAYCLARRYGNCDITIVYDDATPNTTSNHGFGITSIRKTNSFDSPNTVAWTKETSDYCQDWINNSPETAREMGISKAEGYLIYDTKAINDKSTVLHAVNNLPLRGTFSKFRQATDEENKLFGIRQNSDWKHVFQRSNIKPEELELYAFETCVIDNHSYLPWLKKEMELMAAKKLISGFKFLKAKLLSLSDVFEDGYDLIVNCSGLGASYLVPDDKMTPIKGQYVLITPEKTIPMVYASNTFICPKPGRIALGSVHHYGCTDSAIDPIDTEDILHRCYTVLPQIKKWKIITEGAALRPGRVGGPRVELEFYPDKKAPSTKTPVIHNYGHGGLGIMQHWGCALKVETLASFVLQDGSKL